MRVFFQLSGKVLGPALEDTSLYKFIGKIALLGILGCRERNSNQHWLGTGKVKDSQLSFPLGVLRKIVPEVASGIWL